MSYYFLFSTLEKVFFYSYVYRFFVGLFFVFKPIQFELTPGLSETHVVFLNGEQV